jgi:thioredoxin
MATMELTKDNFEATVNGNPIVIVDFWAPWCGPCRGFAPVFEKASESHPDVVFAKVNSDEQQELAGAFNIRSIPTLMLFREKVILFQQAGALPGQALDQVLTQAKSLDMAKVHAEIAAQNAAQAPGSARTAIATWKSSVTCWRARSGTRTRWARARRSSRATYSA